MALAHLNVINAPEGRVKINGSGGVDPSYVLSPNVDQIVDYGASVLDLSVSPTSEFPQNINTPVDANIWDIANKSLLENTILGQTHTWRVILDYSGKSTNDNAGLNVLLRNPLSGFETNATLTLPDGRTSDTDQQALITTIADSASLPAPFGTGHGYELTLNCNKALTVTIISVTRISSIHNPR